MQENRTDNNAEWSVSCYGVRGELLVVVDLGSLESGCNLRVIYCRKEQSNLEFGCLT